MLLFVVVSISVTLVLVVGLSASGDDDDDVRDVNLDMNGVDLYLDVLSILLPLPPLPPIAPARTLYRGSCIEILSDDEIDR